ncbi:alcohol dehydrogenase transcription factor myb/SANT-like domain-containing protein [Phthorimaea operculella]|nr:alcohol dehydrogenase transcription factor myb/SANT-like domain-containing protein [Phthorimaea operculella]
MTENSEECEFETIFFDILEFLAEYKELPCLWDRSHPLFKDRKERLKCEEILGEKLSIRDLYVLRRKIRSVRGTYNTEIRKLKQNIDAGEVVYPPRLFWFPFADKFLRATTDLPYEVFPLCEEQKTSTKSLTKRKRKQFRIATKQQKMDQDESGHIIQYYIKEEESAIDQENNCEDNNDNFEEYEELEALEDDEQTSQNGDENFKFETDDFDQNECNESTSTVSKRKKTSTNNNLNEVLNCLKDIASDNEFVAFGRSVGMQLKNMPLDIAVQLQMEIQSHITKTRLEYLQQVQKQTESE